MGNRKNTLFLVGLAATMLSGYAPEPIPAPVPIPEPIPEPVIVIRAPDFRWESVVSAVKAETLIQDTVLAETVAHAIEDAASEFDLKPWLLASLIRIESGGRPSVISGAGAVGLTQVLPGTAVEIAAELELSEYDLFDPATNVRMGAFYLAKLLERFDSNETAALAAYNFGPTTISRMLREGRPIPTAYASKILDR